MPESNVVHPPRFADARAALRHVFVRDLELTARIGVYRHEHHAPQRIRVNVDLAVREQTELADDIANVVSYETVVIGIRDLVAGGHVNLVETLAESIAALCLEDRRVRVARVRVEKLEAIPDAAAAGVEIERVSPRT